MENMGLRDCATVSGEVDLVSLTSTAWFLVGVVTEVPTLIASLGLYPELFAAGSTCRAEKI